MAVQQMSRLSKEEARRATFLQTVVLRYGKEFLPLAVRMLNQIPPETQNFDAQSTWKALESEKNGSKPGSIVS